MSNGAVPHLQKQLKDLQKQPVGGIKVEVDSNIFQWTVWFRGPAETAYDGGVYKAQLKFPTDFPYNPPKLTVLSPFWHPNVYANGDVCISILHPPGTDDMNALETAQMRWTPIQSIEKVLVSFISLLSDPDARDAGAPANVDALAQFRKDRNGYLARCKENVKLANASLPADFEPPQQGDEPPVLEVAKGRSFIYGDDDDYAEPEAADNYGPQIEMVRGMGLAEGTSDDDLRVLCAKFNGDLEEITAHLMS